MPGVLFELPHYSRYLIIIARAPRALTAGAAIARTLTIALSLHRVEKMMHDSLTKLQRVFCKGFKQKELPLTGSDHGLFFAQGYSLYGGRGSPLLSLEYNPQGSAG